MAERLFLFTQLELPWQLGPPDGRYLLRSESDGEAEWVVVLGTLAAGRMSNDRRGFGRQGSGRVGRRPSGASPDPAPVATARATVIDPLSLPAEHQAQAWLSELDAEREVESAVAVLNRVLHAYRIAAANPYVHEVSAGQALVIRAGFGAGEQVADGNWLHARELPPAGGRGRFLRRRRERDAALRPQERLAQLLGSRHQELVCEELALRARLDLDQGRIAHAAIGLDGALGAAISELRAEGREDLALRVDELAKLRDGVARRARAVLPGTPAPVEQMEQAGEAPSKGATVEQAGEAPSGGATVEQAGKAASRSATDDTTAEDPQRTDEEVVRHALERLEAALRARTATGF